MRVCSSMDRARERVCGRVAGGRRQRQKRLTHPPSSLHPPCLPLPLLSVDARWFGRPAATPATFAPTCTGLSLKGGRGVDVFKGDVAAGCKVRERSEGGSEKAHSYRGSRSE